MPCKLQMNRMIFVAVIARRARRQTNTQTNAHKNTQTQKTYQLLTDVAAIYQPKKLQIQDVPNNAYCNIIKYFLSCLFIMKLKMSNTISIIHFSNPPIQSSG